MGGEITTGATLGYIIDALRSMGYEPDEIRAIVGQVRAGMDFRTVEEAERIYTASPY